MRIYSRRRVRELCVTTVSNLHEIWEHKVDSLWLSSLLSSHHVRILLFEYMAITVSTYA